MPSTIHEIDPFADTIIILRSPCENFAPWEETSTLSKEKQPIRAQPSENEPVVRKLSKKEAKKKLAKTRNRASLSSVPSRVPENGGEQAEPPSGTSSREQGLFQDPDSAPGVDREVENSRVEPFVPASEPITSEDDEIHYLVSSRHLMLASPWFRRALTREGFIEASKDPSDGRYHIPASGWDQEAFLILLNIFHVRTRQVPATVSLEMLAKVAVLVDYYELLNAEVMERDARGWITELKRSVKIPSTYCRDLMMWICIAQVFHMSEEFEEATAVAIKGSEGWIQTLDLPIHQGITSSIDRVRRDALDYIISELHRLLEVYRDFDYSCPNDSSYSFQCGVFLFGALWKFMERGGCLSSPLEIPFMGISLNRVCDKSGIAGKLTWWPNSDHYNHYHGYGYARDTAHPCSLDSKIDEVVQHAMAKVKGLELHDFPDHSRALSRI